MKKLIASIAASFALMAVLGFSLPASAADASSAPSVSAVASASASTSASASATVAAPAAPAAATPAPTPNKGDTAWLMTCTVLVIVMSIPGIALFYGGLVRSKNMVSVLMQSMAIFSLVIVLWCLYGYSLSFTEGGSFFGGFDRAFLGGIYDASKGTFATAATFSKGIVIPEFVYMVFQGAFAAITCCLIIGAFAERIKFSALMIFIVIWFTFAYIPMAHMVWFWTGPDAITSAATLDIETAKGGYLFQKGVLDFAGGTVVHINAAIAGLVGAFLVGKRVGLGKDSMAPHNLTMTMIGAALLWVGWFGFNAGSALEANDTSALAFANTLLATAGASVAWTIGEWIVKGKPSLLGCASGAVAGLVAITPAAGFVGPMGGLVIGLLAGIICLWGVTGLKRLLGADDSLDVFGIHGVGGIVGALLTGVFASPKLGGTGIFDYVTNAASTDPYSIAGQLWVQAQAVGVAIIWSGIVALIAYKLIDLIIGLRVSEDEEREGLDLTSHGESAYHL